MKVQRTIKILTFGLLILTLESAFAQTTYSAGGSNEGESTSSFNDPWEKFNRNIFSFNERLDRYILKPVAVRYEKYTPEPVQGFVSNFFGNLGDIGNFANALLQFKLKDAGISLTRFVINSTIGQMGLVDVATAVGIEKHYQDFGITLARWNVSPGPYVVLPLFGSRTLRSAIGLIPDQYAYPPNYCRSFPLKAGLTSLDVIQKRTDLFSSEKLVTGDKYIFIRDAYLQQRHFLITGEQPADDF